MNTSTASTRLVPWFVPLLAAYPIIFLASRNVGQVSAGSLALTAIAAVVVACLVYGLLRLRTRSATAAGVATVCMLVFFFAYPTAREWMEAGLNQFGRKTNETPNALDAARGVSAMLGVVWGLLAVAAVERIVRSAWAGRAEISRALNFAAVALLAVALVPFLASAFKAPGHGPGTALAASRGSDARVAAQSPDIYYIVLDGYARGDVLAQKYDFRNDAFIEGLRSRGFRVSDRSAANYNWTFLSLASTLNLGYLHDVLPSGTLDPISTDRAVMYDRIRDNETARFLRERGYRIVHVQSTWGATSSNPYADREVKCEQQVYANEFVRAIVEASWLSAFRTKAGVDLAECHLGNFRTLARMGADPGPKFVFAHFIVPHHPYLFDRDGNILRNATVSNQFEFQKRLWEDKQGYVSQLEYVNRLVLETVDGIVASSRQKPIIVIASDHGPNLAAGLTRIQHVAIRLANFGAYLLPDAPEDLIPPDGSAVNQFRRILTHYFDAGLEPLPDRYFISPYKYPFDLREVPTDRLYKAWNELSPAQSEPPRVAAK
jgi:hypothetical protein